MSLPAVPSSPRALSDPALRAQRTDQAKQAPSVLELNRLVWKISKSENTTDRLPYLDPTYGGVDADVIVLLKAPQADADPSRGTDRLISLDNDDEVAATLFDMFAELGIDRSRCVAWNMCPFQIDQFEPNDHEIVRGRKYFAAFVNLLRRPRAVLALGSTVRRGWRQHSFGDVIPGAHVVFGPSPSPPGIDRPGNRDALRAALVEAFDLPTEGTRR